MSLYDCCPTHIIGNSFTLVKSLLLENSLYKEPLTCYCFDNVPSCLHGLAYSCLKKTQSKTNHHHFKNEILWPVSVFTVSVKFIVTSVFRYFFVENNKAFLMFHNCNVPHGSCSHMTAAYKEPIKLLNSQWTKSISWSACQSCCSLSDHSVMSLYYLFKNKTWSLRLHEEIEGWLRTLTFWTK